MPSRIHAPVRECVANVMAIFTTAIVEMKEIGGHRPKWKLASALNIEIPSTVLKVWINLEWQASFFGLLLEIDLHQISIDAKIQSSVPNVSQCVCYKGCPRKCQATYNLYVNCHWPSSMATTFTAPFPNPFHPNCPSPYTLH